MAAEPSTTITWWAVASAFGGSIIGSVAGGAINYFLQNRTLAATKKQRDEDRHEVRKGLAYSLFFKMVRIHSSVVLLTQGNAESIERANAAGFKGALWQKILPHGNLPPRVKFTPEEMALLLSLDFELFNALGPYDDIHNSLIDLFEAYSQRRSTMMEKFGAQMKGGIGTTTLTQAELDWMAPRAHELNGLAEAMLQRGERDSKESKELLIRLHELFVKHFGLNPKLEFKQPNVETSSP